MWLDGRGGGGPTPLAGGPLPPALKRVEDVLDRYEQHTKFCPSCSRVRERDIFNGFRFILGCRAGPFCTAHTLLP